jgi:outer membrane receptor for Fe3+-dicitrate
VTPTGTRLPITPRFKATATARYTWAMGVGKAHVQGSVAHQSSAAADLRQNTTGDPANPGNPNAVLGRIRSSTVVDGFLGYDWSRFTTELFVTNIFDSRNEQARFVACSICTRTYVLPGRPRTIGIRAGVKF